MDLLPVDNLGALTRNRILFRTGRRLVEAFAFKPKHPIGAGTVIFPGNGGSQLHQFGSRKSGAQTFPQFRSHFRGSGRNCIRKFEHQLLISIEKAAFLIPIQVAQLIVADACLSASGRVNVNSKRTFNQLGGAYLRQNF